MTNEKQVRKVLRSLHKKFENKVTAIEETQDLSNMRLDELIENLTTFEMKLDSNGTDKKKGVSLNASYKEGEEEDLAETMSLLAKKFNKTMKRFNKKPYGSIDMTKGNDRRLDNWKKISTAEGVGNIVSEENPITLVVNDIHDPDSKDEEEVTDEELIANY
ncbi:hypothetical protein LIER_28850 [Lithospermum erythrorhizon]|uniref:Gag-pol polyprotein n=1 Tax=Lithospermum erythrorhizon TaxID=34254 RepID=A0AAV3RH67_LITER